MPSTSTALSSYFKSAGEGSSGNSVASKKIFKPSLDKDLKRAMELSAAEAKMNDLSEEEMLQRALEASKAEMNPTKTNRKRSKSPVVMLNDVMPGVKKLRREDKDGIDDEIQDEKVIEPTFTSESFSDKEEVIDRFNGSLDLLSCKGWIRKEERIQLRNWMLKEMAWHRVCLFSICRLS